LNQYVIFDEEVIFLDQQPTQIDAPINSSNHIENFIYLDDPKVAPPLLLAIPPPPQMVPPIIQNAFLQPKVDPIPPIQSLTPNTSTETHKIQILYPKRYLPHVLTIH
jgi:hypothetical protein